MDRRNVTPDVVTIGHQEDQLMSRTRIGGIALLAGSLLLLASVPALAQSDSGMPMREPAGMMGMHGQIMPADMDQMPMGHQQMPADLAEQMRAWHAQMPDNVNAQMQSMHARMSALHAEQAFEDCFNPGGGNAIGWTRGPLNADS